MKNAGHQPKNYEIESAGEKGGEITLVLSGRVGLENLLDVMAGMHSKLEDLSPSKLNVDLSKLDQMDSSGVLAFIRIEKAAKDRAIPFVFTAMPEAVKGLLEYAGKEELEAGPVMEKREVGAIERMSGFVSGFVDDFIDTMVFLGEFVLALIHAAVHPRAFRWKSIFSNVKAAGSDGLSIVASISFLLGVVIAVMALKYLRDFGGVSLLPTIVAAAMIKEFGPLIAAIIVTGRTGSSFAAEIASMRINEEVDALIMMGFNPVRFLAVPKILATIFVMPLLSFYADFSGILGGLAVGVIHGGLSVQSFILGIPNQVKFADVLGGIIKSCAFGAIIAGIGCQKGFKAETGAEEVGAMTTSAVVCGIFLILLADAAFGVVTLMLKK